MNSTPSSTHSSTPSSLPPPSVASSDWSSVQHAALSCVMCGLCLPHCPTFALYQNESEGPRGRISLMLGLANGRLTADASVVRALDHCLPCRACEAMCPSLVPYGQLIDETRHLLDASTPSPAQGQQPWRALRDGVFTHRERMRRLWALAVGLDRIVPVWRRLLGRLTARLGAVLPAALPRPYSIPPALRAPPSSDLPCVGLFIGCMGGSLGADATRAAEQVLRRLGFAVWIPPAQGCCGAMHQHGGATDQAGAMRAQNLSVFVQAPALTALVVMNTACAAELLRAPSLVPVVQITQFLAELPDERWPPLRPLPEAVAIHRPCSQLRVLKHSAATERLLRRIPGVTVQALRSDRACCGAAGMQAVLQPEQAAALRAPILQELSDLGCSAVSANIGCAAHLSAGCGQPVKHPVEWIAAALPDSG